MKKTKSPLSFKISLSVFIASLFAILLSYISVSVADFLNAAFSSCIRGALSGIFSSFRYAAFEGILFISPIILTFLLGYIFFTKGGVKKLKKRFFRVVSAFLFAGSLYIWTLGIAYLSSGFTASHFAPESDITNKKVLHSANILVSEIKEFDKTEEKEYTLDDVENATALALGTALKTKPSFSVKEGELSEIYSKLGIYSYYSFVTGEVIINTEIPEYMRPFVISHEYAHACGARGEADAELFAYISLSESEAEYLRYSAAMCALEYIYGELDAEDRHKVYSSLPDFAKKDFALHADYKKKYSGTQNKISASLNGAHLALYGKGGDYNYFTVLLVSYLTSHDTP